MIPKEEWRPVVGYEGLYEVSDTGRIRSLPRVVRGMNGTPRRLLGREIAVHPIPSGHLLVFLWREGSYHRLRVHRLVLDAFVGPCPQGMVACHYDDDPRNNRIANLRWGTYADNSLDATRNGRNRNALKTHCPKGHPYDEQNTKLGSRRAGRQCRACRAAADRTRLPGRYQMTAEEQVRGALNAYVKGTPEVPQGGMPALQAFTGPDPVESPVFWEAIKLLGANRRALVLGRRPRSGIDKWDRGTFNTEEAQGEADRERKGGNL